MRDLLRPLSRLAASGALDHDATSSLRVSLQRVLAKAPELQASSDISTALFINPELGLEERLDLPKRVWDCATAGPMPYVRPLEAVLDEFRKVAAVVVDSRRAEIVVFYMGEVLDRQVMEAEVVRKRNLTGWHGLDEHHNRNHAEEIRHHLFREIAHRLERMQRDERIELVLVGGRQASIDALLPFLDPKVRAITQSFVVDVHTLTPALLAKTVAQLEAEHESREEEKMVIDVYERTAATELAVIGIDRVVEAANRHAIARLLVHDGATTPGVICVSCGALSRPRTACGVCGGKTSELADLIEGLTRAVMEAGGKIEHVMTSTRLESDLVAAWLRFPVW
jgi:peptide chain release factor subunit 1